MTSRATGFALLVTLGACQTSQDIVAFSYGDYDPNTPLSVRDLKGDLAVTDPSLFFWQGTYYLFSSGSSGAGLDLRSSKDLTTFTWEDPILRPNPHWVGDLLPNARNLWSPCVLAWDGTIHLYYAASWFGVTRGCIGHATTTGMDKPFVADPDPLFCSNLKAVDPYVAIDPAVILDEAGDPWMVFGSSSQGLFMRPLYRNGQLRAGPADTPFAIATPKAGESLGIQAASLYRWRTYTYLFVSFGYSINHALMVGRAQNVTGPYLDRNGTPMTEGGGTAVLTGDATIVGPGSNMVFDGADQRWNVYHAYNANQEPVLRIGPLRFDDQGWPISAGP